ncbi:hypothetical protein [Streptomyces sp. B15]|uniref:hypothetical protein n=1 Tax=Streptomyces sp. B15 TaxID=1537797 RepID=UPI001B365EA5|nr:hypothetical protein [Streptomyces sp. B15]MBQ1122644.1 hypothetical protein [Streptomyces sp. B15]
MIPDDLLPHLVDVVTPGTRTDRYGNTIDDWSPEAVTRQQARAWMQQNTGSEDTDQRNAQVGEWLMVANPRAVDGQPLSVTGKCRIEWPDQGLTFEVAGPPGPAYEPTALHHYEIRLTAVEG